MFGFFNALFRFYPFIQNLDPFILPGIATGIGALGTLFGGDNEAERLLRQRARGIDPKILAALRMRARRAFGNQASALRTSAGQRLGRQGAPVAKQEEVLDKITTRGFGGLGETLTGIDFANEQIKQGALADLAGFLSEREPGAGFAQLFGAGLQGLMSPLQQNTETTRGFFPGKRYFPPSIYG
jgi:hypothetical protein